MSELSTYLAPDAVLARLDARSVSAALSALANLLSPSVTLRAISPQGSMQASAPGGLAQALVSPVPGAADILAAALRREREGGTGIGGGVAIAHARVPGLPRACVALARLAEPLDFNAADGQPCDLVALLASPEEAHADHLRALALLARKLRNGDLRARLRDANDARAMYFMLVPPSAQSDAAA